MTERENGHRYRVREWDMLLHQPYDWEKKGILKKVMSHKITGTDNVILKAFLKTYENAILYCMKYAEVLSDYFWYLKHNR